MTDKEQPNSFEVLGTLPKETFHTLSYPEQLVLLQNLALKATESDEYFKALTVDAVDPVEVRQVQMLLIPEFVGPFAATYFDSPWSWRKWIDPNMCGSEMVEAYTMAEQRGLWMKYVGLGVHDERLMGELVHAISIVAQGMHPREDTHFHVNPGRTAPAYKEALSMGHQTENAMVIGALSPKSVAEWWGMRRHIFPDATSLSIVDIEGVLTPPMARHYGIEFIQKDATVPGGDLKPMDLVLASNIGFSLMWNRQYTQASFYDVLFDARQALFHESARVMRSGGRLVMAEMSLLRIEDSPFSVDQEARFYKDQLAMAGFVDVSVRPVLAFDAQPSVDQYLQTGIIDESRASYRGLDHLVCVTAVKP